MSMISSLLCIPWSLCSFFNAKILWIAGGFQYHRRWADPYNEDEVQGHSGQVSWHTCSVRHVQRILRTLHTHMNTFTFNANVHECFLCTVYYFQHVSLFVSVSVIVHMDFLLDCTCIVALSSYPIKTTTIIIIYCHCVLLTNKLQASFLYISSYPLCVLFFPAVCNFWLGSRTVKDCVYS